MTPELIDRFEGTPISEWIARLPAEMEDIGIGLGAIVGYGVNDFGLHGVALDDFVRRCLYAILVSGGLPLRFVQTAPTTHFSPGEGRWEIETKYGSTPEAIVEGVIADWRASGVPVPGWGEFWFGARELLALQDRS